jgi:hypothetical protein
MVTWSQLEAGLVRVAGVAAIVCSALSSSTSGLPTSVRAALVVVGGVVIAVERYLTGTNSAPTTTTPPVSSASS